jgi:hypothetical protein
VRSGACAKDALDFRFRNERCDIIRHDVFNARIACSDDSVTVKNVSQCDMVF